MHATWPPARPRQPGGGLRRLVRRPLLLRLRDQALGGEARGVARGQPALHPPQRLVTHHSSYFYLLAHHPCTQYKVPSFLMERTLFVFECFIVKV